MCDVAAVTVGRWITEGKMPAYKTAGGHHRVWAQDLVHFFRKQNIPIPDELNTSTRVLVVDDDYAVRRTIKGTIKRKFPEMKVYEAVDGYDLGHKVATIKPDLIILDIRLPDIDGYKVCRMIRADKNIKKIHILAISGFDKENSKTKSLQAGADDFLPKPFGAQELIQKINQLALK